MSWYNLLKDVTEKLQLPKDVMLNQPLISIFANEEVNIVNYISIIEYSENVIRIKVSNNVLKIEGIDLFIKHINKENISIKGTIHNLKYI